MREETDLCSTPQCRGEPIMTYLGHPLCCRCWEEHCTKNQDGPIQIMPVVDESPFRKRSVRKPSTGKTPDEIVREIMGR